LPRNRAAAIEALLIEAESPRLFDAVIEELRSLHQGHVLRLIDVVVVSRTTDGRVQSHGSTELPEREARELQASLGRALGFRVGNQEFGTELNWDGVSILLGVEDVKFMAEKLDAGHAALAVVFEHRWSTGLDTKIHRRGVRLVEDDMITTGWLEAAGRGVHTTWGQ
jgi:uncharacterized membrane protein